MQANLGGAFKFARPTLRKGVNDMDTTDILRGAFRRAREREEAEQPAERPEGGSPGRDANGFVISKSEEPEDAPKPQTKEAKIAEIEAELDRLARERGVARTNPDRSRIAKNIAARYLGQ